MKNFICVEKFGVQICPNDLQPSQSWVAVGYLHSLYLEPSTNSQSIKNWTRFLIALQTKHTESPSMIVQKIVSGTVSAHDIQSKSKSHTYLHRTLLMISNQKVGRTHIFIVHCNISLVKMKLEFYLLG